MECVVNANDKYLLLKRVDGLRLRVKFIHAKLSVYQTLPARLGIPFVLVFGHSPIFMGFKRSVQVFR